MFKKLFAFVAIVMVALMVLPNIVAYAWNPPTVVANCAPDSTHNSFTVSLTGSEDNYDIQWAWNSSFTGATTIPFTTNPSPYTLVVPRGGTTLYVRWVSDPSSVGSAAANGDLCNPTHPTPPPPPQTIGLAMLYCTDNSLCYDKGLDGVCWIKYSLAAGQKFSTANAVKWCDLGPGKSYDPNIMKVYVDPVTGRSFMDEVFLGYPYTKQCWGPDDKGNCVLDQLLAKFNWAHGTHYMYGWLFPGYGGH